MKSGMKLYVSESTCNHGKQSDSDVYEARPPRVVRFDQRGVDVDLPFTTLSDLSLQEGCAFDLLSVVKSGDPKKIEKS